MKKRFLNRDYSSLTKCGTLILKVLRKAYRKDKFQHLTAWATCCIALFTIIGTLWNGCSTRESNKLTRLSNYRAEKIFGSQIQPWVQSKPTKFAVEKDSKNNTFGKTTVRINNYTNFNAFNVKTDAIYQDSVWIREWQKAKVIDFKKEMDLRELSQEEKEEYDYYEANLKKSIGHLIVDDNGPHNATYYRAIDNQVSEKTTTTNIPSGSTNVRIWDSSDKNLQELKSATGVMTKIYNKESTYSSNNYLEQEWKGSCPTENEICTRKKEFSVAIRTIWDNEKGRQFETIDFYILRCTQTGKGVSFTFIPKNLSKHETE